MSFHSSLPNTVAERQRKAGVTAVLLLEKANRDLFIRPIHAKAMPVLLTAEREFDTWLDAPVNDGMALHRPLSNDLLRIVATGQKNDRALVG
jgi:putative SOS response-associated peptidase YedK